MLEATRVAFAAYLSHIASLNGVGTATATFAAAPSVQQTLEDRIQESSDFLRMVNMFGVTEQEGEKIGLSMSGPIASRTNTTVNPRVPKDPVSLDDRGYRCEKTDSDTFIKYALLDAWAKFPDFQTRIRNHIVAQQGRDRMMIGFNGTSVAATTDIVANPLLQDVNKGWLQKLREERPAGVLSDGPSTGTNQVKVGIATGNDYRNLDALVFDVVNELIDPWFRNDTDLVAIVGRQLLHDKYFPIVNGVATDAPTEQVARDVILSTKRLGGLMAMQVPFFPANAIMVTSMKNLSIYYQTGARRRRIEDNPSRDRIDNFESSNDAYVIEELGKAALVQNVTLAW
jgi:P2 family phage major capsid protein